MKHVGPLTAAEIEMLRERLDQTAACARPGCSERIRFQPGARGRRQRFCSGACRAKFSRERTQLHRTWAQLKLSTELDVPPRPVGEIERVIMQVEWLLEGYGGFDKFLAFSLMPPREHVPMEGVFSYLDLITEDELQGLTRFVESVAAYRRGETVLVDPRNPLEPS